MASLRSADFIDVQQSNVVVLHSVFAKITFKKWRCYDASVGNSVEGIKKNENS